METLYDNNKEWSVSWEKNTDGSYTLTTRHGLINGKKIEHSTIISSGKNIGKKNETTILQQTIADAQSAWDKKIKQGYHTSSTTSCTIKPMLAITYSSKTKLTFPLWIQPKLDGVRCLVYRKNDQIVFQSRQNTVYEPFDHLLPELSLLLTQFPENTILDGELYTHGLGFDTIVSMVRRGSGTDKVKHPDVHQLHYTVYDCILSNSVVYQERLQLLSTYCTGYTHIHCIETQPVHHTSEIDAWLTHFEKKGYEGIMLRRNGLYKENRSNDLIKYKRFMDDEFEVVGHHESKTNIPVFECKTKEGNVFSVMMKETMESKQERMKSVTDYYGKWLTVQFQELSKDGIPRFPVGISFRDYE